MYVTFLTCSIPGRGALIFLSTTFFRCLILPVAPPMLFSTSSSFCSMLLGKHSVTVSNGSFVARRFVMMFECSFWNELISILQNMTFYIYTRLGEKLTQIRQGLLNTNEGLQFVIITQNFFNIIITNTYCIRPIKRTCPN